MFKTSMVKKSEMEETVRDLKWEHKKECDRLTEKIRDLEKDRVFLEKIHKVEIEEERQKLRKEMQKSLIESDLKRVEAIAKLEVNEKLDVKNEFNFIKEMLSKLVEVLGRGVIHKGNEISVIK